MAHNQVKQSVRAYAVVLPGRDSVEKHTLKGAIEKYGLRVFVAVEGFDDFVFVVAVSSKSEPSGFTIWPNRCVYDARDLAISIDGFDVAPEPGDAHSLIWELPPNRPHMQSRKLRQIHLPEIQEKAARACRLKLDEIAESFQVDAERHEGRAASVLLASADDFAAALPAKQRKRRGRNDLWFATLASEYVNLLGQPKVNVILGKSRNYSAGTIASQLSEARRRGLLTRSGQGAPGGDLTAKARALLAGMGDE